jgi:uncharacterized SAM-dependent methyltransferase
MPVDVSSEALDIACERIASSLPEMYLEPILANYVTRPPPLESFNGTTLAIYIGSSIGNFYPDEALAYDDRDGVTAEFNLNVLHRLNRELGADFDPASFRHAVLWNGMESRIEMHLENMHDQRVRRQRTSICTL